MSLSTAATTGTTAAAEITTNKLNRWKFLCNKLKNAPMRKNQQKLKNQHAGNRP